MNDYSEYSAPELVRMLGIRFKDYRLRANMTQKEITEVTGLTIPTVQRFENGLSNNISLGTLEKPSSFDPRGQSLFDPR